jgi:hypothetical protein
MLKLHPLTAGRLLVPAVQLQQLFSLVAVAWLQPMLLLSLPAVAAV